MMNHRYKADFSEALDLKVSDMDEPEDGGEFEDDLEDFDPFNENEREGLDELNFEDKR